MSRFLTLIVEGIHSPRVVEQTQFRKAVRERWGWALCWGNADERGRHLQYSGLGVSHDSVETVPLVRVDTEAGKAVDNKMLVVVLGEESMTRNVHRDFWRARTVWMVAAAIHFVIPHSWAVMRTESPTRVGSARTIAISIFARPVTTTLIRTVPLLVATSSILAEEKGTRSCDVEPEDSLTKIIFNAKSKSEKEGAHCLSNCSSSRLQKVTRLSVSTRWVNVPRLLAFLDLPL